MGFIIEKCMFQFQYLKINKGAKSLYVDKC